MIADDYSSIKKAMKPNSEKPPQTPAIGQGGRLAVSEAIRKNNASAVRRHYIARAREQNKRINFK